jgi:diacylglycerol kinase
MLNKKQSFRFAAVKVVILIITVILIKIMPTAKIIILIVSFAIVIILEFMRYRNTKDQW